MLVKNSKFKFLGLTFLGAYLLTLSVWPETVHAARPIQKCYNARAAMKKALGFCGVLMVCFQVIQHQEHQSQPDANNPAPTQTPPPRNYSQGYATGMDFSSNESDPFGRQPSADLTPLMDDWLNTREPQP